MSYFRPINVLIIDEGKLVYDKFLQKSFYKKLLKLIAQYEVENKK